MQETNMSVPKVTPDITDPSKLAKKAAPAAAAGLKSGAATNIGSAASSALGNIGNTIGNAISNITSAISNAVSNAVGTISNFFGGAASAAVSTSAAVVTAGAVGLTGVVGGAGIATNDNQTASVLSDSFDVDDCNTGLAMSGGENSGTASGFDISDPEIGENAYIIYQALIGWGLTENQAYGILANAKCESGILPWRVQSDGGIDKSQNYPHAMDSGNGVGVGLWQFTTEGMKTGLDTIADSLGTHWSVLDTQVVYLLSEECPDFSTLCKYKNQTADFTAADCDRWFCKEWERCGGTQTSKSYNDPGSEYYTHKGKRYKSPYYERWYAAESDTTDVMLAVQNYITNYAGSDLDSRVTNILSAASAAQFDGSTAAINRAKAGCGLGSGFYDNSSIANAALSFAYATHEEATNNKGTKLYQTVYNNIMHDRTYYMSCDRVVILAGCWSGADDRLNGYGGCDPLYAYFTSTEGQTIWTKVGVLGSGMTLADCLPGDVILITSTQRGKAHGHTMIYTGEDMILSMFGNAVKPGSNVVEASFKQQSAHCDVKTDAGLAGYSVFRCTNPMNSDKYKDAGGDIAPSKSLAGSVSTSTETTE